MLDLVAYTNLSHSPVVEDIWRLPEGREGAGDQDSDGDGPTIDHRQPAGYTDLDFWTEFAADLEAGGYTALFFAHSFEVTDRYGDSVAPALRRGEQVPEGDPLTLLSALATATDRLGLVATASTSFYPPYLLATKLSTLDHLADGRLGWNVVTSASRREFENVRGEYLGHDARYDRAEEFLQVCYALWEDSWDDGAVVADTDGAYVDPERVREIDHEGEHFSVPGPHQTAPSPQRTPAIFQAGQSDRGREFAARHAEATFSFQLSLSDFEDYRADVLERARAHGRDPDDLRFLPAVTVYVGSSTQAAERRRERVVSAVDAETGLVRLSNHLNHDFSVYDPEDDLAAVESEGIRGALRAFREDDHEWTVGEAARRYARYPTVEVVGDPGAVATELERWHDAGADGLTLTQPAVPGGHRAVVDHLVPELRDRGLLPAEDADTTAGDAPRTLRERLFDRDDPRVAASHPARDG